jgi:hypothetical protein
VDLFVGFQQGIKELLQLEDLNDPEIGRSADPAERWGVCFKWYQSDFLSVDSRHRRRR